MIFIYYFLKGQPQPPQYGQPIPGGSPQNPPINKQFNSMMSQPYQNPVPVGFQPQPQFVQPNPGSPQQGSPQNPAFYKQLNPKFYNQIIYFFL